MGDDDAVVDSVLEFRVVTGRPQPSRQSAEHGVAEERRRVVVAGLHEYCMKVYRPRCVEPNICYNLRPAVSLYRAPYVSDDEKQLDLDHQMSFGDHLEEFRQRLIYALIGLGIALVVCMVFGKFIFDFLQIPYVNVMEARRVAAEARGETPEATGMIVLGATEGVLIYIRVSLYTAILFSGPWILYQFWQFIAVGLYPNERRYVHSSVPFSAALFIAGALFFVFVVCEKMLAFFFAFDDWIGVKPTITLTSHIKFMTSMMIVFGIGFQTPLVVFVLGKVGLVSLKTFNHYRRHVILGMLIFAALATSPSPIDQILLAVPMWLLYELGVLMVWYFVERPKRLEDDDEEWD